MAETAEQVKKQIDKVQQEIKSLSAEFMGSIGDPTKSQDIPRMHEKILLLEAQKNDLFKKLAKLYHPDL